MCKRMVLSKMCQESVVVCVCCEGDLVGDVLPHRLTAIVNEPIYCVPRHFLPHNDTGGDGRC